jgi:hypothetical protein
MLTPRRGAAIMCPRIKQSVPKLSRFFGCLTRSDRRISFAGGEERDDAYLLIQRQFQSPDGGKTYLLWVEKQTSEWSKVSSNLH